MRVGLKRAWRDGTTHLLFEAHRTKRWRPIVSLKRHHDHRDIWPFYRHADFCMVTSLHDGMNHVERLRLAPAAAAGARR